VATCPKCGLSLTYHKGSDRLTCHYCGYEERTSSTCPECGSKYVKYFGSGTEKVEEIIDEMFPDYKVARVDLDSVKNKGALTKKIRDFRDGKTHILVGTQIIAKGLDFRNVGLVGIISADIILNIPDFRSPERTFQLITQAAGRAGRGDETGQVIIQTYDTEHYCITSAAAQDYERFYEQEISMRRFMKYPPYSDMFQLLFKSEDKETAREGAEDWYDRFRNKLGPEEANNVLRPQEAFKSKINDKYQYTMLIKCPKGKRRLYAAVILQIKEENKGNKKAKKYTVGADVNPYSFE
jgi:primosomal protein N' (replication factor Y)